MNKKKCFFFAPEVEYIGYIINERGIRTNPTKIDALLEIAEPKNLKELQSFIGGVNYYSRFIPNMSTIATPLYQLLKKEISWQWTQNEKSAFYRLKEQLSKTPVLCLYDLTTPLV